MSMDRCSKCSRAVDTDEDLYFYQEGDKNFGVGLCINCRPECDHLMPGEDEILEWVDPDWSDHFLCVSDAAAHYRKWAPQDWAEAIEELNA